MKTEILEKASTFVIPTGSHQLILHNDSHNEFTWVINCLMDVCKHSMTQAEQCTILTHQKGQCSIKVGAAEVLRELKTELILRKLLVTIETNLN